MGLPARPARRLLPLAMALVSAASCRGQEPRRNVLLVTIDTLRADRLGCYGDRAAETPAIDALAREGVQFERAYSPLPLTLPSHATILTGLEPVAHGLVDNGITSPELGAATLAERLSAAGYDTAAFVAAFVLNRIFGLDRGFALYDDGPPEETELVGLFRRVADARDRVDAAIGWLGRSRERPFFLWVHLFDVHAPHTAPEPFAHRFASDPYRGEVAYVDSQVRRLLEYLKWRGLEGRTLVVLTSDHGEGLGEHGEKTHGFFLYDATLRVPLIVRLPGRLPAGRRVEDAATLADLLPSILDLLGLKPNPRSHGVALFADPRPRPDRTLWAQSDHPRRQYGWARLRSVRRGTWKYIDAPRPELYDVGADPGETRNLAGTAGGRARELAELAGRTETALLRDKPDAKLEEPDADAQARLAALGYLAGAAHPAAPAPALDPDEVLRAQDEVDRATALLAAGGPGLAEAEGLFRGLIRRFPTQASLRISLGRTLELMGREEDALAVYREAAERADLRALALGRMVALLRKAGRVEEEVAAAQSLVASFPRHAASRRMLADALARQKALAAEGP